MTSALGGVLEKLLLVDLEICFLALLGEVLFVRASAPSFCLSEWRLLKSWMYSSQFTRCCSGSHVSSSLS